MQGQHINSGTKSAVSRMREEKHEVGNHSWSHEPGVFKLVPDDNKGMQGLTDEEALAQVTTTHNLISSPSIDGLVETITNLLDDGDK